MSLNRQMMLVPGLRTRKPMFSRRYVLFRLLVNRLLLFRRRHVQPRHDAENVGKVVLPLLKRARALSDSNAHPGSVLVSTRCNNTALVPSASPSLGIRSHGAAREGLRRGRLFCLEIKRGSTVQNIMSPLHEAQRYHFIHEQ